VADVTIAFDPGLRIGVAWVAPDRRLLRHEVIAVEEIGTYPLPEGARILVGSGTGSAALSTRLRARGIAHELVDERGTTEAARALYWRANPPRGLGRLVPEGLRPPPRSLDDYAAYAIALRVLEHESADDEAADPGGSAA
jgi:hypothetical protein